MNPVKPVAAVTFLLLVASFPALAQDEAPPPPPAAEEAPAEPESPPESEAEVAAEPPAEGEKDPEAVVDAPAPAPAPPPPAKKKAPWRGTSLSYSHATSALSLNKAAEPLWNPYYLHRLAFRPQWHFGDQLFLRGNFDLGQELTLADDTNRRYEVVYSDAVLDLGAAGLADPWLGVHLSGSLRVTAGLSKVSQAQTRFLTLGPGVSLSRRFGVLEGLTVRYDVRYSERLHRSTTTVFDGPTLAFCDGRDLAQCAEYAHSGVRNTARDVSQSVGLSMSPHGRISFSAQFLAHHGFLYPLTSAEQYGLPGDQGQHVRYAWGFNLGASIKLFDELSLSLGSSTFAPQLTPSSTRRSPFFNRFTNLYVDLGLDLEALLNRL
jgi:hypothetical protein